MYFHLVYFPECFTVPSVRKSTHMLYRQATKLMGTMDHEFVCSSTSPLFAFLSCPFHMGKRLTGVFWDTYGCQKPDFL